MYWHPPWQCGFLHLFVPGDFRWWTLRPHSAETVLSRSRGTIAPPVHFHTGRHGIPWATGESSRALPLGSCSLHPWSWDHAQANSLLHQRTACSASDVHIPKSSGAWRNLCSKDSKLPVSESTLVPPCSALSGIWSPKTFYWYRPQWSESLVRTGRLMVDSLQEHQEHRSEASRVSNTELKISDFGLAKMSKDCPVVSFVSFLIFSWLVACSVQWL